MAGQYLRYLRLPFLTAQPFKISCNYNTPTVCCLILNHRFLHKTKLDQTLMPLHQGSSKGAFQLEVLTQRRHEHSAPFKDDKEFTAFYYFPYIVPMKLFSRLKLVQTVMTVSFVPGLYLVEYYGIIQHHVDKSLTIALATIALSMLYALGEFFRRLIGIMYLSRDHSLVKLSHLTFWGKRKDLVVPVSDVIPLQECGEHKDTVAKLRRYSTNKYLLFSTRFGRILNREMFEIVFGSIYQDQPDP